MSSTASNSAHHSLVSTPATSLSSSPTNPTISHLANRAQGQRQKPKVLFFGDLSHTKFDERIREIAEVHTLPRVGYQEMVPLIKRKVEEEGEFVAFGGLFLITHDFPNKWDAGLLSPLAPACKLYVGPGAGYDKVDIDWISSSGAMYANSPLAVGRRTADGALALILGAMRGITPQDLSVRAGKWRAPVKTLDWHTATIGIIGLGSIGTRVATLLSAIGASHIIYHSRRPSSSPEARQSSPPWGYCRTLDELYEKADVVVLTCPLTSETKGLICKESLGKMKDGVVLVNVARGPVVKEDDLVEALESGKVMRAALDVFENEPEVHPGLMKNPNVTLSPHVAPAPDSMGAPMNGEVVENIIRFLETGMPMTPVNLDQLKEKGFVVGQGKVAS
ncbi:oxidoreductase [Kwoniella heveanensis CBS 569]|nr:oxidoreductase [Kwoniella heveanensis CBS 569]